ncbi:hypothetical protein B0T16DRAFT_392551 [Cercophora newfieldiana]|uniref:Heterokaryon incompatibility domain-containing protein n=1 Tax=Cercophora newfieldiana TaxID=92897 RepID=A0AA40CMM8_9PEZI|nr:hypothetical protein B0T16DRAFT_392551 [Cercophora newfieldiana]
MTDTTSSSLALGAGPETITLTVAPKPKSPLAAIIWSPSSTDGDTTIRLYYLDRTNKINELVGVCKRTSCTWKNTNSNIGGPVSSSSSLAVALSGSPSGTALDGIIKVFYLMGQYGIQTADAESSSGTTQGKTNNATTTAPGGATSTGAGENGDGGSGQDPSKKEEEAKIDEKKEGLSTGDIIGLATGVPAAVFTIAGVVWRWKWLQKTWGNLYDALLQFRRQGSAVLLWADAICINQADPDEKSEQVPPMGEIYRQASGVHSVMPGSERIAQDMDESITMEQKIEVNIQSMAVELMENTLFRSRQGYIGISKSLQVQNGDRIVLARGGVAPMILRPRDDGSWKLAAGDSYVHGIGNGEAFDVNKCHEIRIT